MENLLTKKVRVIKEFEHTGQIFEVVKSEGKHFVTWQKKVIWAVRNYNGYKHVIRAFIDMLESKNYTEEELYNNLKHF